jgi:hypothetical protein
VMLVVAFGLVGRLDTEEKKKRMVYEHFTGAPVDPATMREARQSIRERVMQVIIERAQGLMQSGYRAPVDPVQNWMQAAADPTVTDPAFLGAAFTLARLDASLVPAPQRAQLEMLHHLLWTRVCQVAPVQLPPEI